MKLYRILSLVLALFITLLALTSCSKNEGEGGNENNSESVAATDGKTDPTERPTEEITDSGIQNEILDQILQKGEDVAITDIDFDEEKLAAVAALPSKIGDRAFNSLYVDMGDESYMHVAKSATLQDYSDYLYSLYKAGFSYYTSNVIGNNFYATFATQSQIVNAFYLAADKEVRVVVDDRSLFSLPGLESENEYEELGLNSLTVVAIAETGWPGGMGYVYELSDGSFFIIDGGYYNGSTVSSADWLTKTLQQMATDPKNIRIAAWYITHPHEDHMGAYCDMAKRTECRKTMTIEKMIINVPADEHVKSANCKEIVGWLDSALKKWTPEQIVKAHPGQKIYVRDLTLTIYSSPDLVLPVKVTITDLNELCNVAMVDYMGKRALFMGDSDTIPNPKIARNYTDSLKADILQLAHHGYGDTNAGVVYDYVHPTIVFWPVCDSHYNDGNGGGTQFIGFNQRFFGEGIANYIAGDLNMTFTDFDTWIPEEERWNPKELSQ
ncbi:MAG: hypothetical protein IJW52_05000 [Clostridia bacterium]|nr:hypothetical protein [Clostridia bacterium]